MTIDNLISVFTVLSIFAGSVERLIEIGKPLLTKIPNELWQTSAKVASAVVIGTLLSALFGYDVFSQLGANIVLPSPWIGYFGSGMVISTGSSVIHPILEWLKSLKQDVQPVEGMAH